MTLGLPGGPVHGLQLGRRSSLRPLDWTDRLLGTLLDTEALQDKLEHLELR